MVIEQNSCIYWAQSSSGVFDRRQDGSPGVSEESSWAEFTSFQVRRPAIPRRQHVAGRSVDAETTTERSTFVPHVKLNATSNASTESEQVDVDGVRREKFRQHNVHGHSSDSSVARILYGQSSAEAVCDTDVVETGLVLLQSLTKASA